MKIKKMINVCCALSFAVLASCGASSDKKAADADSVPEAEPVEAVAENTQNTAADNDLINTVYDRFVFAIDATGDMTPENYFTANALKKLQGEYEYDCDEGDCYAFYALRTTEQDSKPGADGSSSITGIEPDGEGWYVVSYSDMGWPGKTRIKIVDGKIDDYQRVNQ